MTVLPSRAFQGNDWSEHANVKRLIDALFDEYEIWYKEEARENALSVLTRSDNTSPISSWKPTERGEHGRY